MVPLKPPKFHKSRSVAAAIFATSLSVILCGCGPEFRVSPHRFEYCHPSVQWIYRTGSEWGLRATPATLYIPILAPWNYHVARLEAGARVVRIVEGCEAKRDQIRNTYVDFRSGIRGDAFDDAVAVSSPLDSSEPTKVVIPNLGTVVQDRDPRRIELSFLPTTAGDSSMIRLVATAGSGWLSSALFLPDQGLLLLAIELWTPPDPNPSAFVLCVDVSELVGTRAHSSRRSE